MRTNKACPLYQGPGGPQPSSSTSLTEVEEEDTCRLDVPDDEELINVDGTKIKLSGKVIKVGTDAEFVAEMVLVNLSFTFARLLVLHIAVYAQDFNG